MMSLLLLAVALLVMPTRSPGAARLLRLCRDARAAVGPATPGRGQRIRPWFLPSVAGLGIGLASGTGLGGWWGALSGLALAVGVTLLGRHVLNRERPEEPDPLRIAGGWDLLAACLRSGLPVPLAIRAVAPHLPSSAGAQLHKIADRLALGGDPATAWDVPESSPVYKLARAARRSAATGSGLAGVAEATAAEVRAAALDIAIARGQRAGVLITGPLGLCFLPAFLALGVVPVVIGLASGLAVRW